MPPDITNEPSSPSSFVCPKIHLSFVAILLLALIELTIIIWNAYDHSIPCWDTAMHRLNSMGVYDLLQNPNFRSIRWYRSVCTVSQLYPPLFYILSAGLKFICGEMANTDFISNLIFIAIMFFSVYYTAKTLFKNNLVGPIAGVLIFLYPAVFWTAHNALLDCAANAMVAFGLAYFFWWTNNPCTNRSIVLGIVLGLAVLTKNNTPIFFVGPILVDIIYALQKRSDGSRNYARLKQLGLVALTGFLVILPWIFLAGPTVIKFVGSIQEQDFGLRNRINEALLGLTRFSFTDLPAILSPLLLSCFLIALITFKPFTKNKIYLVSSVIFSIIIASLFRWPHQFRYIVPAAAPIAVLTAQMFAQAWSTRRFLLRAAIVVVAIIALLQVVYDGFNPYPIRVRGWIRKVMQLVGEDFKIDPQHSNVQGISIHPLPNVDWGVAWVLSIIEKNSQNKLPALMVMSNTDTVNCSPYIFVARMKKFEIRLGSPREHTELGDRVRFNPQIANWYNWYVLKTGDQGLQIGDPQSVADYDRWCKFIRSSKNYKLVDTKQLPDQSILELYRRLD